MTEWLSRIGYTLALPVLLVAAWWFASAGSTDFYFPPLARIVEVFPDTWFGQRMVDDVLPSLGRLAVGYLAALVLGIGLGMVIGTSRWVRALAEPLLEFLRAIPPPVLVPVLILVAGIGSGMKILVIISGCLWPVLLNTVEGVRAVDGVLDDTCRTYRIRGGRRWWHLMIRSASPQIVTGARQALSIGIILMVISEMTAASSGIGYTVIQFKDGFRIPQMWTGVILLGLLGVLLSVLFRIAEHQVLRWYHGSRTVSKER